MELRWEGVPSVSDALRLLKEQAENLNGAEYSALEGVIKSYYSLNEQHKKFSQRTYAFARKANDVAS